MFKTVKKERRSNLTTNFFDFKTMLTSNFQKYYHDTYFKTNKIVKFDQEFSEDKLTKITTVVWNSEQDLNLFKSDSRAIEEFVNIFNDYCETNKIIVSHIDDRFNEEVILGPNPYPNLTIPDTWKNVDEFAHWWLTAGMPIMVPDDAEVFLSDDATSVSLFRKNNFQVELYLIHPNPLVPVHGHPDVEVIKVRLSGKKIPFLSSTLKNGGMHGAGIRLDAEEKGYPLLAIQHWLTKEPTTIASMWKGNTVGPKQEELIKRFNPDAYVVDGYADITRSK
jgi:hypothetical protein